MNVLSQATDWLADHPEVVTGSLVASLVVFFASIYLAHRFLTTMPPDYFTRDDRSRGFSHASPLVHSLLVIGKNLVGALLILAGIVMLFVPGQGLLTLLLGLALIDMPGKRKLEQKILSRPAVLKVVNQLRARAGQPPLELDASKPAEKSRQRS